MNIGVYQKSDHGGENDGSKHIAKCSIKFLQIIQRQIKLSSWALRGKKKKKIRKAKRETSDFSWSLFGGTQLYPACHIRSCF